MGSSWQEGDTSHHAGHVGKYKGGPGDGRSVAESRAWRGVGEAEQAGWGEFGAGSWNSVSVSGPQSWSSCPVQGGGEVLSWSVSVR